jgi:hypothetical protein
MGFPTDRWFSFRPIDKMIDAGLSVDAAYTLVREFANTSAGRRRSILQRAVRSAATISDLVIKTGNKQSITLKPDAVAAFCQIISYYDDPSVRRLLAMLLGKQEWRDGIPVLGYLLSDEDETVQNCAASSLDKLDHSLLRVLKLPGNLAKLAPPEEPSIFKVDVDADELNVVVRGTAGDVHIAADRAFDTTGPASEESVQGPLPEEPPAATIQRFTQVDYAANAEKPRCGEIALTLKVKPEGAPGKAVDIRVRKGKEAASLVVHASSPEFKVTPETQRIAVPRNKDGETARFAVEATGGAAGSVMLTIFDETRFVGSVRVNMEAVVENKALVLRMLQVEVFRDAGASVDGPGFGITIQVSLAEGANGHINFHTPGQDETGKSTLSPLGSSPQSLQTVGLQNALSAFRKQVQDISDNLLTLQSIGASSRDDAFKALGIKFDGLGTMIYTSLVSVGVRAILDNRASETVVHWVIKDDVLDAIPWEFAFQKLDALRVSEPPLLVRVPVWSEQNGQNSSAGSQSGAQPGRVAYVLGDGVVTLQDGQTWSAKQFNNLMKVVSGANTKKFELKPNFSETGFAPVSITTACTFIGDASIVHMLCHGVSSENDLYLQLTPTILGQVRPSDVYAWRFPGQPLVFVNACSSSAAGVSPAGFTTFGKSFLHAGASVYIGTLAPVVTETAIKFATEFFNALLGDGLSVADAMNRVRKSMTESADPNWRLYSIYGDLQAGQFAIH